MSEKGLYSPIIRRIITIVLLIGITGSFLAIYYLIYLPQQRTQYNLRMFRVLHEISSNFKERVENYGKVYSYNYISQIHKDDTVKVPSFIYMKDTTANADTSFINNLDTAGKKDKIFTLTDIIGRRLDAALLSSFKGNALSIDSLHYQKLVTRDSIRFSAESTLLTSNGGTKRPFDTTLLLADILEPIITVHTANFESFILIKQRGDTEKKGDKNAYVDTILYKSENANIANINTDSLLYNKNVEAPVISNLNIEGISYKLFLLPFKLHTITSDTYVLGGLVSEDTYKSFTESVPIDLLLWLSVFLIVLLLVLPFMKIFFLSPEETITIRDVRTIITVIFIIPFFLSLACSFTWLYLYRAKWTADALQNIQDGVAHNFYEEINDIILQMKDYDSVITNAHTAVDSINQKIQAGQYQPPDNNTDLKELIFYPHHYKGFTSVHWINDKGNNIAAWSLTSRILPTYFKLSDRDYFKDIKYNRGHILPNAPAPIDTYRFSIQPVLSRLTGEYTINIAGRSHARIRQDMQDGTAAAIGLSGKMYSVWNTVVPKGFAFCIVDESGRILCHSDTARSLQENIFQESGDSLAIRHAISHKDSTLLNDVDLYEQPVRMLIKPLQGLPYYLITYYNKRGEYLFLLHITGFAFLCESVLLLFASLFAYCMTVSSKHINKLLFTPASLQWIRPSADKKNYYIKIIIQCIICIVLIGLFALIYIISDGKSESYYLFMVNAALLLPLFNITGYYIVKKSRDINIKMEEAGINNIKIKRRYNNNIERMKSLFNNKLHFNLNLLVGVRTIIVLYVLSIGLFYILQNVLFFSKTCYEENNVKPAIWALIILVPTITVIVAGFNTDYKKDKPKNLYTSRLIHAIRLLTSIQKQRKNNSYLHYFIISLLLGVVLMSVIPTLTFVSYAFRQEKTLQSQSFQFDLAKNIQQRRTALNQLYWKTKLNIKPFDDTARTYIQNLKFDTNKGIYLLNNDTLAPVTLPHPIDDSFAFTTCSPFYKAITQFLFLPPDHDDFYDNSSHNYYYNWHLDKTSLRLFYKNTTDNRDTTSFNLVSTTPRVSLFSSYSDNYHYLWKLALLILMLFIILFYKTIYTVTKRVFLIGYFQAVKIENKDPESIDEDTLWLQENYKSASLKDVCKDILPGEEKVTFALIRKVENDALTNNDEEEIIRLHLALKDIYEDIWNRCTDVEKYTLYDFATDGFTNYKQTVLLYDLYKKGLIVKEPDGNITLMTKSFRNFLITKQGSEEVKRLSSASKKGSWGTLRSVFYIILIALAIFIFISQEEASKRLITIVTSLGALLPAILKLFDKSTFNMPSSAQSGNKA